MAFSSEDQDYSDSRPKRPARSSSGSKFFYRWTVVSVDHYEDPVRRALLLNVPDTGEYCLRLELQLRSLAALTNWFGAILRKDGRCYSLRLLSAKVSARSEAELKDALEQLSRHELIAYRRPPILDAHSLLPLALPYSRWLECLPEKRRATEGKALRQERWRSKPLPFTLSPDLSTLPSVSTASLRQDETPDHSPILLVSSDLQSDETPPFSQPIDNQKQRDSSSSALTGEEEEEIVRAVLSLKTFQRIDPVGLRREVHGGGIRVREIAQAIQRSADAGESIRYPLRALRTGIKEGWDAPPPKTPRSATASPKPAVPKRAPEVATPRPTPSSAAVTAWNDVRQRLASTVSADSLDRWFGNLEPILSEGLLTLWCPDVMRRGWIQENYWPQLTRAAEPFQVQLIV